MSNEPPKIKYYMALCKHPEFRVRQDEPYTQMQIQQICSMYDVKFVDTKDIGEFKFYLFRK